jgi:hypothetical protein
MAITPDLLNSERSKPGKIDCHSNQSYSKYLWGVSKLEESCDVIPHIQERQHSPLIQQALLTIEIELTQTEATETREASQGQKSLRSPCSLPDRASKIPPRASSEVKYGFATCIYEETRSGGQQIILSQWPPFLAC